MTFSRRWSFFIAGPGDERERRARRRRREIGLEQLDRVGEPGLDARYEHEAIAAEQAELLAQAGDGARVDVERVVQLLAAAGGGDGRAQPRDGAQHLRPVAAADQVDGLERVAHASSLAARGAGQPGPAAYTPWQSLGPGAMMQLDIPVTEIAAGDQFVHDGKIYWTATDGAVVDGKLVRVTVKYEDGGSSTRAWDNGRMITLEREPASA